MKRHSYTRFTRIHRPDIDDKARTLPPRWEFGLIRYDTAAYGSNPDDTKSEHQEYLTYGLAATCDLALQELNRLDLPADAKPLHRESRVVGVPSSAWSMSEGGATPAMRGSN